MPGFSTSNRPKRAGSYTRFIAALQRTVPPTTAETVAIPFTHNWGPYKQAVTLDSYGDFLAVYGDVDGPGKIAVEQAFKGEGVEGFGGAGSVICYRFGGSTAAKATRILTNTTPATALTLRGKYEGTRGNALRVTVQTNAADGTKKDLIIKDGALVLETFTALATTPSAFRDAINNAITGSAWVTADATVIDGVALTNVSDVAFTAGDDGTAVVAGDWTNVMNALEPERFAAFAPYDLTDSTILASLKTWVSNLNEPPDPSSNKSKRFLTVVGGNSTDDATTALARSATLDSPYIINFGIGTWVDRDLGELTTSKMAPRIAGILVNRGEQMSISFARLEGILRAGAQPGATESQIVQAQDGGVLTLGRDSHTEAPWRLERARTSYRSDSTDKPNRIYKNPKFLMTMGGFETEINEIFNFKVIGKLPAASRDTREFVLGEARRIVADRVTRGVIAPVPAPRVEVTQNPPPLPTDEFVALDYEWTFGRSTEQVFNSVVVN